MIVQEKRSFLSHPLALHALFQRASYTTEHARTPRTGGDVASKPHVAPLPHYKQHQRHKRPSQARGFIFRASPPHETTSTTHARIKGTGEEHPLALSRGKRWLLRSIHGGRWRAKSSRPGATNLDLARGSRLVEHAISPGTSIRPSRTIHSIPIHKTLQPLAANQPINLHLATKRNKPCTRVPTIPGDLRVIRRG